jgi:excisionase family DNA binding protein
MTQIYLPTHPAATITVEQFADYWGVKCRIVYHLISKGALPAVKIGRSYRILTEDARAFGRVDDDASTPDPRTARRINTTG